MDKEKLKEFNDELKNLLEKYNVVLGIEDVPATQKVVVKLRENAEETGEKTKEGSKK